MKKYILKRLITSIATLVVIIFVLFLMMDLMPGSPFNDEKLTEAQKAVIYAKYGLDKPFFIRFLTYVKNILRLDLGVSYSLSKNVAVTSLLSKRLLVSVILGLLASVIGLVFGYVLGICAGVKQGTWVDSVCTVLSTLGISVPAYIFAVLLCYYLGFKLELLPIIYNSNRGLSAYILPAFALSLAPMANIAKFARTETIDVLNSDYIALLKSKGVSDKNIIIKHVIRNTMIPIITVAGPIVVGLLTGSSVIEIIFGIPGIGSLMVNAIKSNDYNVVLGCALVYSLLYTIVMLIVDILYSVIDPRIRVEGK